VKKFMRVAMVTLLATMVMLTVAQSRQFGGGFGGGPAGLVNSKTALADIKATEEQVEKLKEWAKDYQGKQMEFFKGFKDMSKEERTEKQAALTADAWKGIGKVLKEDQVKRLKQIELQVAGVGAFMRPDVSEALKITDDQKGKIGESMGGMFKDMQALREEFGLKGFGGAKLEGDKQKEYDKKLAKLTKEMMSTVQDAMTDDQKKKWKEMVGDPIDVQKVQAESRPNFGNFKKKD
jgi:hypothetical protein